jgi:hypothetical protein
VFGNVETHKKIPLDELWVLDGLEERALCDEEKVRKNKVISDLERAILLEAKVEDALVKEGDKCSKFFHQVANSNRRNNSIELLLVYGSVSSDQIEIRDHIVHFYDGLFSK